MLDGIFDGHLTHESRLLGNGCGHFAFLDGFEGIVRGVKADHNHSGLAVFGSNHSTQGHFIVVGEDALEIRGGLEHVFHDSHAFSAVEIGSLLGSDIELAVDGQMETGTTVIGR